MTIWDYESCLDLKYFNFLATEHFQMSLRFLVVRLGSIAWVLKARLMSLKTLHPIQYGLI